MAKLTRITGISSNEVTIGETVTVYFDGSNATIYIENNDGDVDVLHTIESNDNGQYSFIPSHSGTFLIYTDKIIIADSVTLTVIPTLNGALEELGETLATNLTSMGVTASATDGLTTLANAILDIEQGGQEIVSFDNLTTEFNYTQKRGNYGFSVTIPSGVTSLGISCFNGCAGLTSVIIPSGVTSLGNYCFSGCSGLTNITIPSSVTSLGIYCFRGCSGLTNVTIPSGVTSLGMNCFDGCSGLTNITIPSGVTSLGYACFRSCSSLTSITIPSGVTSLENYCFNGCSGLTNITIPSSVTNLGTNCFSGCTNLVDYQLYWRTPPVTWNSGVMPNNADTYFTIPNGTTANYVGKSFPSDKLIERSE